VELHHRLQGGAGQALAGADDERHAGPAPRIDLQAHGGERLGPRSGDDTRLEPVAVVLPAHHDLGGQRRHRLEHLHPLVAQRLGGGGGRRFHGQQGDHLEQVVLHHVPDRPDLVVEPTTPLDPERLGHGDLHPGHVATVPHRFEQRVGEAEHQDVLDRLLAQVVVDAEHRRLGEGIVDRVVELPGGPAVTAEGLLHDEPAGAVQPGGGEPVDHRGEHRRWDGHVVHRGQRAIEHPGELGIRGGIPIVAGDHRQPGAHPPEGGLIGMGDDHLHRAAGVVAQLVVIPRRHRHTDHGDIEGVAPFQVVQRGEELLAGEITGRPEHDQDITDGHTHGVMLPS
jgi:hypothetical protein